jgi:hypothetical protein
MIRLTRPVTRESCARDQRTGRPYVIQLPPGGKIVRVKLKGTRTWYTVTIEQLFMQGARNAAAEIRHQKIQLQLARRMAGRGGRAMAP